MAEPRSKSYGTSTVRVSDAAVLAHVEDAAIDRGRMVAETLFHIAAVRSLPGMPAAATIACIAAKLQDASATAGQQAAHLLPGAITVNGIYVWELPDHVRVPPSLAHDVLRLQGQLMWCFGKTTVLPASVNRADSEAERTTSTDGDGLKDLFAAVVHRLWSTARVKSDAPLVIDRTAVMSALGLWFARANVTYDLAHGRKQSRGRASEARVLRTYADSFLVQNPERFVDAHAREVSRRYRWL